MKKRLRRTREFAPATATFLTWQCFGQGIDGQAAAVRTERLALIRGPPDALERVSRVVIGHPHDAGEAQRASSGAKQEML
jgi:hypothetical protein